MSKDKFDTDGGEHGRVARIRGLAIPITRFSELGAAYHSFYLRSCYLENKLATGEMVLAGETIDVGSDHSGLQLGDTRECEGQDLKIGKR